MLKRNRNLIIAGSALSIALIITGISAYQTTRFNKNITINHTKVGRLTADRAIKKLTSTELKNQVYIGNKRIFDGKDTKMGFTNQDLPDVQKLLSKQRTFFPSSSATNYTLVPEQADQYRSQTMKKLVQEKLLSMNRHLTPAKDSEAQLKNGQIIVTKSVNGTQYDFESLMNDYQKHEYDSVIYLKNVYIQPVRENSPIVAKEKKMLEDLLQRTVNYQVQGKVYSFKAGDIIKNASVSKKMQYTIDTTGIQNKIADINRTQSTLNKNFAFRTHSGSVISVKGQSYGWRLDAGAEAKRIQTALEKGEKSLKAYNVYGVGYSTYGIGYHTTANHGIGNTYAEVSIQNQQIWIYKNGQLMLTTHVVTGRHNTNEDTPPGVWYIMYKESPSTLEGSEAGNPHYSVKVSYWAPFTLGGVGFHDASWRTNWSGTAYLNQGSGGCVNTPPTAMKSVYHYLSQNEPVIVY